MEELESAQAPLTPEVAEPVATEAAETAAESRLETEETLDAGQLLDRLAALLADSGDISTEEIARIKQRFYAIHNEKIRLAKAAFIEAGNEAEAFVPEADETESRFKELLARIKDKKADQRARLEAEQAANLDRKKQIIAEITTIGSDTDNVNRHYQRMKELQAAFKEIGEVPPAQASAVWKSYQEAVEHFYDQWKVNKELRDYDFKKNLAEKQLLLAEAESLAGESDVVTAFRRLQNLHDKWREIGPVAREVREEIWAKFKDASAEVNKRYQAFFEERKKREQDNEAAKTAICERLEALDFNAPATFAAWDEMTKAVLAAQEEWKTLGYASRKANNALFARFRGLCDDFFSRKSNFFKSTKEAMSANLAAKIKLCEQAEALQDSTDWRNTAEKINALQKEWRTIGSVPRKHSDEVWKRFQKACDTFFDNKKKDARQTRSTEQANLAAKKEIVERLTALNSPDDTTPRDKAIAEIQELRSRWQSTGHVPFKEKDKIHEQYRALVGDLFDKFDIHEKNARRSAFESSVEELGDDASKLRREHDRLCRIFEARKSELQTYENNLGFFNSRSKSGDSMVREIEKKTQRLRSEIDELAGKIKLIASKL